MDAVIGQRGVDRVGYRLYQGSQKISGDACRRLIVQLGKGELAGTVYGDKQVKLAFGGSHLGDVDVEITDGIDLELLFDRFVALSFRQTADPMAL